MLNSSHCICYYAQTRTDEISCKSGVRAARRVGKKDISLLDFSLFVAILLWFVSIQSNLEQFTVVALVYGYDLGVC